MGGNINAEGKTDIPFRVLMKKERIYGDEFFFEFGVIRSVLLSNLKKESGLQGKFEIPYCPGIEKFTF